jgi:hypothetical protein
MKAMLSVSSHSSSCRLAVCCGVHSRRTAVVELDDVVHSVTSSGGVADVVVGFESDDGGGGGATVSLLGNGGGRGGVVEAGLAVVGRFLVVDDEGDVATSSS